MSTLHYTNLVVNQCTYRKYAKVSLLYADLQTSTRQDVKNTFFYYIRHFSKNNILIVQYVTWFFDCR
jgi:hypothetical protein